MDLLSSFQSGVLTVGVGGFPLLKVDAASRSIEVEAAGVKQTGIKISRVIKSSQAQGGVVRFIKESESTARALSRNGWELSLYDRGSRVLVMGRGVSKLTGYVHANPLKLGKILLEIF